MEGAGFAESSEVGDGKAGEGVVWIGESSFWVTGCEGAMEGVWVEPGISGVAPSA